MTSIRHKNNIVNTINSSNNEDNIKALQDTVAQTWNTVLELKARIAYLEKILDDGKLLEIIKKRIENLS